MVVVWQNKEEEEKLSHLLHHQTSHFHVELPRYCAESMMLKLKYKKANQRQIQQDLTMSLNPHTDIFQRGRSIVEQRGHSILERPRPWTNGRPGN